MADSPESSSSRLYSSRLTEKLANEAEMLLFSGGLTEIDLDDKFDEIKEKAKSALTDGTGLTEDLLELAELISQNGGDISIDGSYQLNLSEDKMSITLSIRPPVGNGKEVTYEDIITELKKRKITRGVCINAIRQAVDDASNGKEINDTVVVRGTPPIPGAAPWVVYFGRITDHELDEVTEDHLTFENDEPVLCEEGDTIAYIREGDGGMPGYTADGTIIPPPKPTHRITLRPGKNVTLVGNCYISEVSGVICLRNDEISVQKALIYNRDLGSQDSPVEYDGSIIVHGGVRSNVIITATEDIIIDRVVEGATITSTGGNVVLHAGIAGRNKGRIYAGKDFEGAFVENATVEAANDIRLQVGALNSHLTANRDIIAESGKGGIAGGVLIAGRNIHVKNLGSSVTKTDVIAATGAQDIPALKEICLTLSVHQKRLHDVNEYISRFDRAVKNPARLAPKELKLYTDLHKLRVITEHEIKILEKRRKELMEEIATDAEGEVAIYQKLSPNVQFTIGPATYHHKEARGPIVLRYNKAQKRVVCKSR